MPSTPFTDQELIDLLVAVGVDPPTDPAVFDTALDDLEIDSLGRTELAARLRRRFAVDIESDVAPDTTPNGLRELVRTRLTTAAG